MGDGTNYVVIVAGALLEQAEYLLKMGLHPAEVMEGFDIAAKKALEFLEEIANATERVTDVRNPDQIRKCIRSALSAKQYGYEDLLTKLVTQACFEVMPKDASKFNVDNVRVVKILGGSVLDTAVLKGMVFPRQPEGDVKKASKAKVVIFSCPLDIQATETKGTVLLKSAGELINFSKGEEQALEQACVSPPISRDVSNINPSFFDLACRLLRKLPRVAPRL